MSTPTDAELFEEATACGLVTHVRLAAACHPEKVKLEEVCSPANAAMIVFARAVLARYGTAAPQPIPVSERLPEAGDCDAEGRCWWWRPNHPESGYSEGWMLRPHAWGAVRYDFDDRLVHTHWLPAHALPLPSGEVE